MLFGFGNCSFAVCGDYGAFGGFVFSLRCLGCCKLGFCYFGFWVGFPCLDVGSSGFGGFCVLILFSTGQAGFSILVVLVLEVLLIVGVWLVL